MTIDKRKWTEEELAKYGDDVFLAAERYLDENPRLCSFGEIENYVRSEVYEFDYEKPYERQTVLSDILDEMIENNCLVKVELADYNAYIKEAYFWARWDEGRK